MAVVTRSARASFDTNTAKKAPQVSGDLFAGADVEIGPGYIGADGLAYNSNGAANNAAARVRGFFALARKAGEPVVLYGIGTRYHYSDGGLTPGADLYLAAVPGGLDTAPTTGGTVPIAYAVNTTDIVVMRYQ